MAQGNSIFFRGFKKDKKMEQQTTQKKWQSSQLPKKCICFNDGITKFKNQNKRKKAHSAKKKETEASKPKAPRGA